MLNKCRVSVAFTNRLINLFISGISKLRYPSNMQSNAYSNACITISIVFGILKQHTHLYIEFSACTTMYHRHMFSSTKLVSLGIVDAFLALVYGIPISYCNTIKFVHICIP
ncbi:MAG: putative membrane protein [Cenarchaeum symbiont of Oopsacas minuta]|nr:putative membrane protein [Cenarchaeum symbiont of Oopsacas minuta]